MQIKIDDNNVVIAYARVGKFEGGIEVDDIPSDFVPYKYLYIDGEYKLNPDYVEPADEPVSDEPSANEILNVLLGVSDYE